MDILTIVGFLVGFGCILGGNALEGGSIKALINVPAAFIVFGGSLGTVMIQLSMHDFMRGLKLAAWCFKPPKLDMATGIGKIIAWSAVARKEGLFALQEHSADETDPFVKRALELLIDGGRPEDVRVIMEVDIETKEHHDMAGAKLWDSIGGYCPTIGIVGAVMGLITVMANLANPEMLGHGIATAFVATIYAVAAANIVFLPFGNRIKAIIAENTRFYEMMLDGLLAIAEGMHPHFIKARLSSFAGSHDHGEDAHGSEEKK